MQSVISGRWGPRHAAPAKEAPAKVPPTQGQLLVLALVLAARLPLDGLLLAAQALYHALPDDLILALLRALAPDGPDEPTAPTAGWKDATVLALHHGLLAVAVALVPNLEGDDGAEEAVARRPGQPTAAGPSLRRAVVDAVLGATIKCTLRECRATSQRTKAAFRMLHTYLCTVSTRRALLTTANAACTVVVGPFPKGVRCEVTLVRKFNCGTLPITKVHFIFLQCAKGEGGVGFSR